MTLSSRPSAPRSRAIASWMMRGDSGPPRAPRKSGSSGASAKGTRREIGLDRAPHRRQHRHDALAPAFADDADRVSTLPVGASARFSPSASEMRRPQP